MIGTLAWAERSQGRLGRIEALAEVRRGMALQLSVWGDLVVRRLGLGRVKLALREVALPTSPIARETEALCRRVSAPWLVNHCLRTYVWGELFAVRDAVAHDSELLYCASLLHDLGITEAYPTPAGDCFAVVGARAAGDFLRAQGVDAAQARTVADAISLHLNVAVGLRSGSEAFLLSRGVGVDVIGLRVAHLPPDAVKDAVANHPRLGMKRALEPLLKEQARQSPRTRIGLLCRSLQFTARMRHAPFAE
jgi:hypothetical protein